MKTGFNKIWLAITLLLFTNSAFAIGSLVAAFQAFAAWYSAAGIVVQFAVQLVASAIISRVFAPDAPTFDSTRYPDPGNRQQVPPATDNKLPIVYGNAYVGGTIIDLSITNDNQQIYYVLALSEVTNSENGNTGDVFSFGNVYWAGKKVIFSTTVGETYKVTGLLDESSGLTDTSVAGLMEFYLYRNGSNTPTNSSLSAITVMSDTNLTYKWDSTKLMSNCAFVIVKLTYSRDANITGMQQTRFQVINTRSNPGDCFLDYFRSSRYGAALAAANVDTASLTALNAYCSQVIPFTPYTGGTNSITRFRFDGVLLADQTIMSNIQMMANCCDCLVKYNEITSKWGVIIQQPTYSTALTIDDSNLIGSINISPLDISNTFNIAEVKFVDNTQQDTFASSIFDLAQVAPYLLYPNEPVNKQTITLPLVNDNVRAQVLANRFLKSCREDLQVQCVINYVGIQLEAGDIVALTNTNYQFSSKLFRVQKVTENFAEDGAVTASLMLAEFNPAVYADTNVTQFAPAPNSGFLDPSIFGTVPAPVISGIVNSGYKTKFNVVPTTSTNGIIEFLEIWYSTVAAPTTSQLTLLTVYNSTTGQGFAQSTALSAFEIATFQAGTYYFFVRVGNALKTSIFSTGTQIIWNPTFIDNVASITNNGLNLSWTPVANWRIAGYKLRYQNGVNTDWSTGLSLSGGLITSTNFTATSLAGLQTTVMVKAVDTAGNESPSIASTQVNTSSSSSLVPNVFAVIDFKANGWQGTLNNCSVVGGNLVANVVDSFYGSDLQSFYGQDTYSLYGSAVAQAMSYTTAETQIGSALAGSVGVLNWTATGNNPVVEYRQIYATPFYGADGDSKYGIDDNASFYGGISDFLPMPASIVMQNGVYQFRISLGSGSVGQVSQFNLAVDVPDIVEVVNNLTVTGGAIPYTRNFTAITNIQATLQQNALGVVAITVDKSVPLTPTITGYNSSQVATSGAKADIVLQGY
jgi:hypothetical protein